METDCACRPPLLFTASCPERAEVAIIGGGFSGLLTLIHVLRHQPGTRVVVIERQPRSGPGLAYGACAPSHLLNVPAGKMGAFPDDPGGFFTWLDAREPGRFQPDEFIPRVVYADYLLDLVASTLRLHGGEVRLVRGHVRRLTLIEPDVEISLRSGETLTASSVVLALGLPMASAPWERGLGVSCDPWSAASWIGLQPDERVIVVGTGLTALDVLVSLEARGHRGPVVFVSRNGRFPLPHAATHSAPASPQVDPAEMARGPRHALRAARTLADTYCASGGEWQAVLDAVRPHVSTIWQQWSARDRQRFLRRLRPFWEVHRHRAPAVVLQRLQQGIDAGRITNVRGEVDRVSKQAAGVTVAIRTPGGALVERSGDRLFNCIGPTLRLGDSRDPLIRSLLDSGVATADAASLGLSADEHGCLRNADGGVASNVFLLGALRRGDLWESTAVPELRVQAASVGASIAARISADRAIKNSERPDGTHTVGLEGIFEGSVR